MASKLYLDSPHRTWSGRPRAITRTTTIPATGAAAGGWALDNTDLDLSSMIWIMAGLVLIPGLLWTLGNVSRARRQAQIPQEEEELAAS